MQLTSDRLARYLIKIKDITNYFIKLEHKDRNVLNKLIDLQHQLLIIEGKVRELKSEMIKDA